MTTPTPEQFLAQPSDPEEDVEEPATADPLTSIAESLRIIAASYGGQQAAASAESELEARYASLDRAYEALARDFDVSQVALEQVASLIKPSTSKLANAIREVLEPTGVAPGQVADTPLEQPADDAPVEDWRAYGAARGLDLTDNLNRSQIRSALGIPQPVTA